MLLLLPTLLRIIPHAARVLYRPPSSPSLLTFLLLVLFVCACGSTPQATQPAFAARLGSSPSVAESPPEGGSTSSPCSTTCRCASSPHPPLTARAAASRVRAGCCCCCLLMHALLSWCAYACDFYCTCFAGAAGAAQKGHSRVRHFAGVVTFPVVKRAARGHSHGRA